LISGPQPVNRWIVLGWDLFDASQNINIIGGWAVARTRGIERNSLFSPVAFRIQK
jgi:hypothetical protein